MPATTYHPRERAHTMTQEKGTQAGANLKAPIAEDKDFRREMVRKTGQQLLEVKVSKTVGAEPGNRTEELPELPGRPPPPALWSPGWAS